MYLFIYLLYLFMWFIYLFISLRNNICTYLFSLFSCFFLIYLYIQLFIQSFISLTYCFYFSLIAHVYWFPGHLLPSSMLPNCDFCVLIFFPHLLGSFIFCFVLLLLLVCLLVLFVIFLHFCASVLFSFFFFCVVI